MDFILKSFKNEINVSSLANVHYFEFSRGFDTKKDSHGFSELVYAEKGSITIDSDNYSGKLCEGEMIIHGAGEGHALSCGEAVFPNIVIIGFKCDSERLSELTRAPLPLTEELTKMLAEIVKEGLTVYMPPYNVPGVKDMKKRRSYTYGADQMIKNYLEIFLIKCLRLKENEERSKRLRSIGTDEAELRLASDVKKYLDCNFCHKIRLLDLCFLFNTNKTTLSRAFKAVYGLTVIDYVNTLRISYTKELLTDGRYTLTNIAEMMNMSSVHYLTAMFKQYTGMTPTEYLAQAAVE